MYLSFAASALLLLAANLFTVAQSPNRLVDEYYKEVLNYVSDKSRELAGQGKRIDRDKRESLAQEQKNLAKRFAAEISARPDLKGLDIFYLAMLFNSAENDDKTLETMKRFLAQYPADTKGDAIQTARNYVIVLSARKKQFVEAEQTYQAWLKGEPLLENQRPAIEQSLAVSYFKDGKYEEAIKYGQSAFELLKTLEAETFQEKRSKEQLYINLVEVLALSYRKNKNSDEALKILAEARARSFTLPSANLYRKVMDFVEGSGFSEKKLMQKVESYAAAEPAPELAIDEWLGQEPAKLENLRGKIVLLDFWATWCGPCIATFPRLRNWHKKFGEQDFMIIGVTQFYGEAAGKKMTPLQELDFLREFKQKHKLPYGFAVSKSGEASEKYGIGAYPTTVLLDRNGVVRYIGIGAGLEESDNLESMIKKLLKEDSRLASSQE